MSHVFLQNACIPNYFLFDSLHNLSPIFSVISLLYRIESCIQNNLKMMWYLYKYMLLPNSMQYFSTLPLLYRLYQHCMVKFFHCMVKFFHCMVKFFHCMVIYLNSLQILREILCITTSDAFALQIMLFNKSCCILEALFISAQHFLSFVVF